MTLAIVSALADEQRGLIEALKGARCVRRAGRDFWVANWHDQAVVLGLSGIGKVAAASTAATLIEAFGVDRMVLTGVAGGLGAGVAVGDVVVASEFLQHDLDASPLFERYVVPQYGCKTIACDAHLTLALARAVADSSPHWRQPGVVHQGLLVSGDQFIGQAELSHQLLADLTDAGFAPLAVEMEGAAFAQVCLDHGVAFAAVRTISDRADDTAHIDFQAFVSAVAGPRALAMISQLMLVLRAASG